MVMCARAEAGSLLGLPSTVSELPYTMTAKASSGANVRRLSVEDFGELMKTHPGLTMDVVRILAGEVRAVRQAIADIRSQIPSRKTRGPIRRREQGPQPHEYR